MYKKVVFFDLDGTLLDQEKKVPISTKKAIKQLKENGIYIAFATGRTPSMLKKISEELDINSYVCCNGSYVVFEGEVVYENPLDIIQLKMLEEHVRKNNQPMIFGNQHELWCNRKSDKTIKEFMNHLKVDSYFEGRSCELSDVVYHAIFFANDEHVSEYLNRYPSFDFIRWDDNSIDVLPRGGSKARGIEEFIKKLGISHTNSYAFGDGHNDIEMLNIVGTGIAMGNAPKIVKESSDYITKHVNHDGVHHGLKKFGLI